MTDADKIALVITLIVILAAAAFALTIVFRRWPPLLESVPAMGRIGFR